MAEEFHLGSRFSPARTPTLRDVATIVFRHKRLLITSFLAILSAGVFYAVLAPSYKAEMKILVRRGRIDPALTPTQTASPAFEHNEISEEEMNSEVELLRDDDILRNVVIRSGLGAHSSWISDLRNQTREVRTEKAVQQLAAKLEVRPVRKSRLITISYSSADGRLSAEVLRELADDYLKRHTAMRRPSGQQTFFETQMKQSGRALDQAQQQLMDFTRKRGVVSAELERDLTLQKLSEAESADLGLRASIAETTERTRALEAKLRDLPERRVIQVRNADNQQLQEKLKSKLLELELRRTELLTKFQPSYRLVQEVNEQISQAKSAIEAEDLKPLRDETTEQNPEYQWAHSEALKGQVELEGWRERHATAQSQISAYRAVAQRLGVSAIFQRDLEQKLKSAEEKYLLYVNKREEARIGDSLDENGILNVAIAEPPHVPALPLWPLWSSTCIALFGATLVSTSLIFAVDYLDPSLRTPEDVVRILGAPVLAALPKRAGVSKPRLRAL
jgi:succinoglycan biosynthesis transport protein ExoP